MPAQVHGARLAGEPAGELVEDAVGPIEGAPDAADGIAVVGRVVAVVWKRGGGRQTERFFVDGGVDVESGELLMQGAVEVGDRESVVELERAFLTVRAADAEAVVDEIEVDLEGAATRVESPCRESADIDVDGTCHQWFRGGARASRTFPTTCVQRWRVVLVGSHSASGRGGSSAVTVSRRAPGIRCGVEDRRGRKGTREAPSPLGAECRRGCERRTPSRCLGPRTGRRRDLPLSRRLPRPEASM